jgi:hypothetical protein
MFHPHFLPRCGLAAKIWRTPFFTPLRVGGEKFSRTVALIMYYTATLKYVKSDFLIFHGGEHLF